MELRELLEEFYRHNRLADPEDIDSLLEVAEITRQLITAERLSDLCLLINYTIREAYFEALSWIMAILQEEACKTENNSFKDFTCCIGKSISHYNEFIECLRVEFNVIKNDVEKTLDPHGEVQSFSNIFTYRTGYPNIFLVTTENFDTKDNDYIEYRLLFTRNSTPEDK